MTREQVGKALEYEKPTDGIEVIHRRHKDRLDKYSTTVKLTGVDGKQREHIVYNAKGVYEICRFSRQPKADALWILFGMCWKVSAKAKSS